MTVFRKEAIDGLRDRRSLGSAFLFAWLGPVLIGLVLVALARDEREPVKLQVQVQGVELAPSLMSFLAQNQVVLSKASPDPEDAVRSKKADVVLSVSSGYAEDFQKARSAKVRLIADPSRASSRKTAERVRKLITAYATQIASLRLLARGVSPEVMTPVLIQDVDTSIPRQRFAQAVALLPAFLLVAAFVAGMNLANDSMAGERERRSLESLLLNPVSPWQVALGKWLAISAFSVLGVGMTLLCTLAVLHLVPLEETDVYVQIPAGSLVWMLAATVPLGFFAAGLELLVSTFARSFKEGQAYLSLLILLPMMTGILAEFFTVDLHGWMVAIPVLSQQQLLSALVRGQTPEMTWLVSAGSCALLGGLIAVAVAARLLRCEKVIFGR
jgi:sodium transport system permease protein